MNTTDKCKQKSGNCFHGLALVILFKNGEIKNTIKNLNDWDIRL